jgi:hypothetical protein
VETRIEEEQMKRKILVVAAVVAAVSTAAAGAVATRAKAEPAAVKQRVVITVSHGTTLEPFVLTSHSSGPLRHVRGTATFCCWTIGTVVRDGQKLDIGNPKMTLAGKRGTIVTRNRIVWMTVPNGAIYTGTWKVIRATGAYAGLTGGGLAAGVQSADGDVSARFTGFVRTK